MTEAALNARVAEVTQRIRRRSHDGRAALSLIHILIVDTILDRTPLERLPWAMALIAFVVGIPLFFEVGVVILIPVVMFAAKRAKVPVILFGIPALAGLSALHGLVRCV